MNHICMNLKLAVLLLAVVSSNIEGRPQEIVAENEENPWPLSFIANIFGLRDRDTTIQTSKSGPNLFREVAATGRSVNNGIRKLFSDLWTSSAQAFVGMNSAFRETAVEALKGVGNVMSATGDFMQDAVRAGGKLASTAVTSSLNITRDAIGATGQLVGNVARSTARGFGETAKSTVDFVDGAVGGIGRYTNSANDVARRLTISSIDSFTDQN
ncbi:uncharacterized protein LOC135214732 [Macrobrachium nipponense]|uniref:uncharacterized protein LOC135214732 n=1 Tax=Macrobrachium nipponense TaxID=159736 RepID=UPI0030C8BAEF